MGFGQNAGDRLRDAVAASKSVWNKRIGILLVVAISVTILAVVLRFRPSKSSRAPVAPVAVAAVPKVAPEASAPVPAPSSAPPVKEPTSAPAAAGPVIATASSAPLPVAASTDMAELRDAVADLRTAQANARDTARETSAEWSAFCEVPRDLVGSLTRMAAYMEETLRGFTGSAEEHEKLLMAQRVLGESLVKAVVQLERAANERTAAADKQQSTFTAGFSEVVQELRKLRVALAVPPVAPVPQARVLATKPVPQRSRDTREAAAQKLVQWKGGWITEDEKEQYEAQLLPLLARFASQRNDLKEELLRGGFSSRQEYNVARMNLREAAREELVDAGFASEQVGVILKEEFR